MSHIYIMMINPAYILKDGSFIVKPQKDLSSCDFSHFCQFSTQYVWRSRDNILRDFFCHLSEICSFSLWIMFSHRSQDCFHVFTGRTHDVVFGKTWLSSCVKTTHVGYSDLSFTKFIFSTSVIQFSVSVLVLSAIPLHRWSLWVSSSCEGWVCVVCLFVDLFAFSLSGFILPSNLMKIRFSFQPGLGHGWKSSTQITI